MKKSRGVVLSCYDFTTKMVKPWAEAGYDCICVDVRHKKGRWRYGNIVKIGADMLTWDHLPDEAVIACFFPPCQHLAVCGASFYKDKELAQLIYALQLVDASIAIAKKLDCPFMIENPISRLSTLWRKPNYIFHPYQYGDPWSKKTCLWTGQGFRMPNPRYYVRPNGQGYQGLHNVWFQDWEKKANVRGITSPGFARAVYLANAPHLTDEQRVYPNGQSAWD